MSLGSSRPRNWGREAQASALALVMKARNVVFEIRTEGKGSWRHKVLYLAASKGGTTLPFTSVATLANVKRGQRQARHHYDGRLLATGVSLRDVVRATIEAAWR